MVGNNGPFFLTFTGMARYGKAWAVLDAVRDVLSRFPLESFGSHPQFIESQLSYWLPCSSELKKVKWSQNVCRWYFAYRTNGIWKNSWNAFLDTGWKVCATYRWFLPISDSLRRQCFVFLSCLVLPDEDWVKSCSGLACLPSTAWRS